MTTLIFVVVVFGLGALAWFLLTPKGRSDNAKTHAEIRAAYRTSDALYEKLRLSKKD